MRRAFALIASGLLVVGLCAVTVAGSPSRSEAREGGPAPRFTLPAVPGGPTRGRVRMTDHIGEKPIVLLFWATWCQPCRQELPLYQRLYERFEDDLVVVGISMDGSNTLPQAGPMARRLGLTFPIVSDLDSSVTTRVNPRRAAPYSVWIDRRGRIVREREGFSMSEREEIVRGIARLVRRR
jgi:peroxiredoxin